MVGMSGEGRLGRAPVEDGGPGFVTGPGVHTPKRAPVEDGAPGFVTGSGVNTPKRAPGEDGRPGLVTGPGRPDPHTSCSEVGRGKLNVGPSPRLLELGLRLRRLRLPLRPEALPQAVERPPVLREPREILPVHPLGLA